MAQFCPQCGSPLAPGQNFCPVCGAQVAAPAAPQQPVAPQYQPQPQPQYQQPYYGAPQAAPAKVKNLWAIIAGGSVALLGFIAFIMGCAMGTFSMLRSSAIFGILWFLCAAGICMFFLAQRPFNAQLPPKEKIFSMVFMGTWLGAWLFVLIAMLAIRSADVILIFALMLFIACGVFGVLTFMNLFKQLSLLSYGFMAVLTVIFLWFLGSLLIAAGEIGMGFFKVLFILTPMLLIGAGVVYGLHYYLKAPETKLF